MNQSVHDTVVHTILFLPVLPAHHFHSFLRLSQNLPACVNKKYAAKYPIVFWLKAVLNREIGGNSNSCCPTTIDKFKVFPVIKKHLRHDIVSTVFYFFL